MCIYLSIYLHICIYTYIYRYIGPGCRRQAAVERVWYMKDSQGVPRAPGAAPL